jgi:hypothetical protein
MMMRTPAWAAIALAASTALGSGLVHAQGAQTGKALAPLTATPVRPSPINALPAEPDEQNLEQQEAMNPPDPTLNAQLAALGRQPPPNLAAPVPAAPLPVEMAQAQPAAPPAPPPTQAAADPAAGAQAPQGPTVAIARRFVDAAGAFERYMRLASAIHADFGGDAAVMQALDTGAAYEQTQLEEGAVAYGALAALQDPAFVRSLASLTPDPNARLAVASQLVADPGAVMQVPGANRAAARVSLAVGRLGASLYASGAAVKQAAYDIQHQAWSRGAGGGAPGAELAHIKSASATRVALRNEDTASLMTSLVAMRQSAEPGGDATRIAQGPPSPVTTRALALAALAVLGEADEAHADQVSALLADPKSAECVKMARLNLYQCLSVAGTEYENVFCLGQHAMMDTAQCVVTASGWRPATSPGSVAVPIAMPAPEAPPAPVLVPVALAAAPGGQ